MRILVSAYSCEPHKGSEPGVGWNWIRQIAQRFDCHLITRENNVASIEAEASRLGLENLTVHGYDLPYWARFWKRGSRGSSIYYYLWQLGLIRFSRKLDRQFEFDVVHHLTYVSSCWPSGLAFLRKPFVWGPVGQHPRIPSAFIRANDYRTRFLEACKAGIKWVFQNLDPLFHKTLSSSDLILSLSRPFGEQLQEDHGDKVISFTAIGVDELAESSDVSHDDRTFDVLFAGRLVELKGVRLAVSAFADFSKDVPEARFRLLGNGPLDEWIRTHAEQHGIGDRVILEGHLSHEDALAAMNDADVFLFPSFEGAGMVVLEAMAAKTPVLCLDFGGPGAMTHEGRGFRVPLGDDFETTVARLAAELRDLHANENRRVEVAERAYEWIGEQMTWTAKGERIESFYTRAIEHWERKAA